jgi:diguanylate cyclase (GGDEF)-like protein
MPAAARNLALFCAALCFALTFGAFLVYERPGLGLGHFYYVAIALAAMAVGPRLGMAAGLLATVLYAVGVVINPHIQSGEVLREGTLTRAFTYVTIGSLIGWFASGNRLMLDELRVLAERDMLTGLPNTRAFEAAITRRLAAGRPFGLLLADMDALKDFNRGEGFAAGNDALRSLADQLTKSLGPDDDVARVGSDEFAVLAFVEGSDGAARHAARLERMLADDQTKATLGWAAFPHEGDNALALYRAASERLYARKVMRSYLRAGARAGGAGRWLGERELGVGLLDDGRVVRRAHNRDSAFARNPREELADRERVRVVEPRRRLVGQQEVGLRGEGPRDGDPLLFARREPRHALLRQLLEPDQREHLVDVISGLGSAEAKEELDVLAHAQERDERRLLGDEREPVPAERCAAGPVELVEPFAENEDLARARQVEAREQVQERRLARARRAGDDGQPPGADRRAQAGQDGALACSLHEGSELDRDAVGWGGRSGLRRLRLRLHGVFRALDQHRVLRQPRPRSRADPAAAKELFRDAQPAAAREHDLLAVGLGLGLLGADPPVADVNDAVGDRRRARIVADDDRCRPPRAGELSDQLVDDGRVLRIELAGRLVGE